MKITQARQIQKLLDGIEIEVYQPEDILEINSYDDLYDYLMENDFLDVDVIYYSKAMDYLMEHDPSLTYSLELAHERGCTTDNINSELLASLLATQHLQEELDMLRDDIANIIEGDK